MDTISPDCRRLKILRDRYIGLWVCLFLAAVTILVYLPVKDYGFVSYDDPLFVSDNLQVQKGLTLETVKWAFSDAVFKSNYFIPVTWLSFLLDYEIYGNFAGGYHLTNLLLHVLNVLLFFTLWRRLTGEVWPSAFAAVFFALHPLHVESVAWVTERKDVLSTLFFLLTIRSYAEYVHKGGVGRYVLTLFLFILGLMAKPMLVTLPFVLLLLDFWPLRRNATLVWTKRIFKLFWEKWPFFVIVAITAAAAFMTQGQAGAVKSLEAIPLGVRLANVLVACVAYIGKMFWPSDLAFLYPHPEALPFWQWAGAFVILAVVTVVVWRYAGARPYLAVGWLWYLGTLFPVSGIVVIGPHAVADRYAYVPLMGLYLMVSWELGRVFSKGGRWTMGIWIAGGAVLLIFAMITRTQIGYWQNSISLYERAIAVTRNNYIAYYNCGNAYLAEKKPDQAIRCFEEALRIEPCSAEAFNNLGLAFGQQQKLDSAIDCYQAALRCDPRHAPAYNNFGNVLASRGKPKEAAPFYQRALSLEPENVEAHNNLGLIRVREGNFTSAVFHFTEANRINRNFENASKNLNRTLALKQTIDSALLNLKEVLQTSPEGPGLEGKIKILKEIGEKWEQAISYARKTLSFQPGFHPEEFDIENYEEAAGVSRKYQKMIALFERLATSKKDSPVALYWIAGIYALQNKDNLACSFLEKAYQKGFDEHALMKHDKNLVTIGKAGCLQKPAGLPAFD